MDKFQLNTVLNHYLASSSQQAEAIAVMKNQYPYSQLLQVLAARTAKDHKLANHEALLQAAAVYCTDRSVLKAIMTSTSLPKQPEASPAKTEDATPSEIDYADKIVEDMKHLQELKHTFEKLFMNAEQNVLPEKNIVLPEETQHVEKEEIPESEHKQSKRQRLIELAKDLLPEEQLEDSKKAMRGDKDHNPILEEIKATKKKIQPANEKTKEQIELIEHYIKTKPSRTPPQVKEEAKLDLASTLKSGEFGDNIVSETLAEILIKQGKKGKAIEVYQKLIWKFPQKKAYFAAQIEDLRK